MRRRFALSGVALFALLPVAACVAAGCSDAGGDSRFDAVTNDEYTEAIELAVSDAPVAQATNDPGPPPAPPPGPPPPPPGVDGGTVDSGPVPSKDAGPGPSTDSGPGPIGEGGTDGGGPSGVPSGFWRFDDCSPESPFLLDSTGNGAHAQHPVGSTCAQGMSGQAVAFHVKKDMVQIADQPQFTVGQRIAAAAWVKPNETSGHHPVVIKRLNDKTTFSLGIHEGMAEFQVVLANGKTVRSRAPVDPNVWSHVAGLYDGRFLFLLVNGEQVGQVSAAGTVRNVNAPIRIGATSQTQVFDGLIDDVWVSTNRVTVSDLAALSCIRSPSTFTVSPPTSGPVSPGTTVDYAIRVTDNDVGACQPQSYFFSGGFPPLPGIQTSVNPFSSPPVAPGGSFQFDFSVTGSEEAEPGRHDVPFSIFSFNEPPMSGSVTYELVEPTGCRVNTSRELMIRDLSVVDDPVRTTFASAPDNPHRGAWTFGRLARDLVPTPADAPDLVERLFQSWLTDQTINGLTVPARPAIQNVLFNNWPRTSDGKLDLDRSPLRLLSIVNRIDLRDLAKGQAGEGRFVFGVLSQGNFPEQFTVILEYALPANSPADVLDWANAWHALSDLPFPSEAYNSALESLTQRFTARGAGGARPNGSALNQLRTNEISLVPRWELRQFELSATSGFFDGRIVTLTPDLANNGTPKLARFVNQNERAIVAEQHTVPAQFEGAPFAGGAVFNDLIA